MMNNLIEQSRLVLGYDDPYVSYKNSRGKGDNSVSLVEATALYLNSKNVPTYGLQKQIDEGIVSNHW